MKAVKDNISIDNTIFSLTLFSWFQQVATTVKNEITTKMHEQKQERDILKWALQMSWCSETV